MKFISNLINLAVAYQGVTITENGVSKQLYLATTSASVQSNEIVISYNNKAYLAKDNISGFSPDMYYTPNLLGGSI